MYWWLPMSKYAVSHHNNARRKNNKYSVYFKFLLVSLTGLKGSCTTCIKKVSFAKGNIKLQKITVFSKDVKTATVGLEHFIKV